MTDDNEICLCDWCTGHGPLPEDPDTYTTLRLPSVTMWSLEGRPKMVWNGEYWNE